MKRHRPILRVDEFFTRTERRFMTGQGCRMEDNHQEPRRQPLCAYPLEPLESALEIPDQEFRKKVKLFKWGKEGQRGDVRGRQAVVVPVRPRPVG